ncbi:hypothetical protein N0V84_004511 [Fusarium piperis]|uniref:Uncharacterized protein n=1 Tax=Fusarium piperis TaxID=1435070 RepID=A0A9W8WFW3_9HYPO|nr:hypothetical protein N0V84_004511 [Fusarium piperis]
MDHIQGTPLNALSFRREVRWASDLTHRSPDLTRVYDQLADIYIQLRGLEFPEIGSLGMPTSDSPVIAIRHRPLPVEVALQEVERLNPTTFFPKDKTFTTDREYIKALVGLSHNRLTRAQDPDLDTVEVASEVVLAHDEFYKHMLTAWLRRTRTKMEYFCESIARRSRQHWPQSPLEEEWRDRREPHCALVLALLYPDAIYQIYWKFLVYDFYSPPYSYEIAQERFAAFLERPGISDFLSRRVADQKRHDEKYELYVREHGKPQDCRCFGCDQQRRSFEILQELPRL